MREQVKGTQVKSAMRVRRSAHGEYVNLHTLNSNFGFFMERDILYRFEAEGVTYMVHNAVRKNCEISRRDERPLSISLSATATTGQSYGSRCAICSRASSSLFSYKLLSTGTTMRLISSSTDRASEEFKPRRCLTRSGMYFWVF